MFYNKKDPATADVFLIIVFETNIRDTCCSLLFRRIDFALLLLLLGHPIRWWAYSWVFFLLVSHLTWTGLDDKQTARVRVRSLNLMRSISAHFPSLRFVCCLKWIESVFITSSRTVWKVSEHFSHPSGDQHGREFWSSTHQPTTVIERSTALTLT